MTNEVAALPDRPRRNKIALASEKFGALHQVAARRAAMLSRLYGAARLSPEEARKLPSLAALQAQRAALALAVAPQATNEAAARWLIAALVEGMGVAVTPGRVDFLVELLRQVDAENKEGDVEGFAPAVLFSAIMRVAATAEFGLKPAELMKAARDARATYRAALAATDEAIRLRKQADRFAEELAREAWSFDDPVTDGSDCLDDDMPF